MTLPASFSFKGLPPAGPCRFKNSITKPRLIIGNGSSSTRATLVVTPTPGVGGTMTVTVAAGSFTDLAGNANDLSVAANGVYPTTLALTVGISFAP